MMDREPRPGATSESVRERLAWEEFLAAIRHERDAERAERTRRVGEWVLSARWAQPFREFWVCMRSGRMYRCRDADHVFLDIDASQPWELQVVTTDRDGFHVLDAAEVRGLFFEPASDRREPYPDDDAERR
jgi:hypothetical protein